MSSAFQPRAWLRLLLCQLLACLGLMLGAGSAWAASLPGSASDEPAPMCDPDGASVAAGDEIPEVDRGHFEALPCEAQRLMAGWRLDDPQFGGQAASFNDRESPPPRSQQTPRRYEGARELAIPFPERAEPKRAASDPGEILAPSRGHSRGLFRPPLARR